jgi:hypothetical protein
LSNVGAVANCGETCSSPLTFPSIETVDCHRTGVRLPGREHA